VTDGFGKGNVDDAASGVLGSVASGIANVGKKAGLPRSNATILYLPCLSTVVAMRESTRYGPSYGLSSGHKTRSLQIYTWVAVAKAVGM